MAEQSMFDNISPLDYRYADEEVKALLSENAFTQYKLRVEVALVNVLAKRGLCSEAVALEVAAAAEHVTTEQVYEEEHRIKHDIRALANCLRDNVSEDARRFVHLCATSYDIVDTAIAARFRDAVVTLLLPRVHKLLSVLITITDREADTVQIGRTHGQHAVPITFGYAVAGYVSRLGESYLKLRQLATDLRGKFSGAVGGYNSSSLFFDDAEQFEVDVLEQLGLKPAEHSTQIAPPEPTIRLLQEVILIGGIMAQIATDMRQLQRTEIGEVGEAFAVNQVGSSTMPQKRNPINFENVVSMQKILIGRSVTLLLDQTSEHQRDLTNSASGRTNAETIGYVCDMVRRMTATLSKLVVDEQNVKRNLAMQHGLILAEPLYLILASLGHPDAHEKVRQLTLSAQTSRIRLQDVVQIDAELQSYLERMTPTQREILADPNKYVGIAATKARVIAFRWKKELELFEY